MNLLRASANRLSACGRALRPWLWRTLLPAAVLDPSGQASPAERQGSRRKEYWAAHAGGPRAQQAGKLETRRFVRRSRGGDARLGASTFATRLSARRAPDRWSALAGQPIDSTVRPSLGVLFGRRAKASSPRVDTRSEAADIVPLSSPQPPLVSPSRKPRQLWAGFRERLGGSD
jgi:hypothetical protein